MRGKAYRRYMQEMKNRQLLKILTECRYTPNAGYVEHAWVDGTWQVVGNHIKYPKNSKMQKYLKRKSKRKVRRTEFLPNGNSYRKCMEYRWEFY